MSKKAIFSLILFLGKRASSFSKAADRYYITDTLGSISLATLVLTFSIVFTLNFSPLYNSEIKAQNISETTGYSQEEIQANYKALIKWNSILSKGPLKFPTMIMSDGGRQHFVEVKRIFIAVQIAHIISSALCIILLVRRRKKSWIILMGGGAAAAATPVLAGATFLIMGWDRFFVLFHQLMFDNELWLFDAKTDPIIRILPDSFFLHCLFMIVGITIFLAVALFILGVVLRRRKTRDISVTQ